MRDRRAYGVHRARVAAAVATAAFAAAVAVATLAATARAARTAGPPLLSFPRLVRRWKPHWPSVLLGRLRPVRRRWLQLCSGRP